MHVAHRAEDGREQSIIEHSMHTAEKCWQFALEPWKAFFYEIALTHDIGKYQERFQKRIRGESIHAPHALCGAQFWRNLYGRTVWSMMAQYVIAGHHAGLPDYGSKADDPFDSTLCGTNKRACEDYSICAAELPLEKKDFSEIEAYIATGCTTISDAAERFAFLQDTFIKRKKSHAQRSHPARVCELKFLKIFVVGKLLAVAPRKGCVLKLLLIINSIYLAMSKGLG